MIQDLAARDSDPSVSADICVIGAGIAGLLLAVELRRSGISVVVLESGGRSQDTEEHPLNRVINLGMPYHGAARGRARCIGGTSTLWGGALLPFLREDLEARPHVELPSWPLTLDALLGFLPDIEARFGVAPGPYDAGYVSHRQLGAVIPADDPDFEPRFAKWPTFKKRNLATLFRDELENDADLSVWLNATATGFSCAPSGRLQSIQASAGNGRRIAVHAKDFAICAGAIEATRLLLLLDRQHDGRVFQGCGALGRYFHDHVSLPAARLHARQPTALNRMAGFRFDAQTMRSLRFELSPSAQKQEGVASAFGHVSFAPEGPSGFDALRKTMRTLQKQGRLDMGEAVQVLRDVPYLARAGYWRFVHHQLLWPTPARYDLHVVAEQLPRPENRISLASESDALGCPLAAIDWRVEAPELAAIDAFSRRFGAFWKRHGLDAVAELEWLTPRDRATESLGDIFHPGGTTRMGTSSASAVVDADLRTFAVPNVWVASTSVFPSGASANPTLMLMLLTLRLAAHLKRQRDGV